MKTASAWPLAPESCISLKLEVYGSRAEKVEFSLSRENAVTSSLHHEYQGLLIDHMLTTLLFRLSSRSPERVRLGDKIS